MWQYTLHDYKSKYQSSLSFPLYAKELGEWNTFSFLFENNFLDFTYLRNKTSEYVVEKLESADHKNIYKIKITWNPQAER